MDVLAGQRRLAWLLDPSAGRLTGRLEAELDRAGEGAVAFPVMIACIDAHPSRADSYACRHLSRLVQIVTLPSRSMPMYMGHGHPLFA